jgi:hypothetical protein
VTIPNTFGLQQSHGPQQYSNAARPPPDPDDGAIYEPTPRGAITRLTANAR